MLVLASQSPRRSEILRQAGFEFTVRIADIDEAVIAGETPEYYVQRLAVDKALRRRRPRRTRPYWAPTPRW